MPSLTKKIIKGHAYYYARECQRVDGKPKIVWQKYLGRVEDIVEAVSLAESFAPTEVEVAEYGLTAALYDIASDLGVVEIIDRHCPKRAQGVSVGRYMLLAAINRCCEPRSKNKIGEWYESTVLRRLMPIPSSALSSRRFWDNMELLDREAIHAIERDLVGVLIERERIDLACLLYDTTNFFTYVDTDTVSAIPQRGHNKQRRNDLKQIGLALLVSRDYHVPLFHEAYPGNVHDCQEFGLVVEELTSRFREFSTSCRDITLVFDKGNNSASNIGMCQGLHYVGSLVPSQHSDLLAVPLCEYTDLPCGDKAYLTSKRVYGKEHVICLVFNQEFHNRQMRGLRLQIAKREKKLAALANKLEARRQGTSNRRPPAVEAVKRLAAGIVKGQHMSQVINYSVTEEGGDVLFAYRVDEQAVLDVAYKHFGKNLLFTDRKDKDAESIVLTYRSQYQVEDAFKQMKDTHHVSFSPVYHWTDHKIRVHTFYCVLALMLSSLLVRRLHSLGIRTSAGQAHEQLSKIMEVLLLYPRKKGKPKAVSALSKMSDIQSQVFKVLDLGRFARS
jgi:transposase